MAGNHVDPNCQRAAVVWKEDHCVDWSSCRQKRRTAQSPDPSFLASDTEIPEDEASRSPPRLVLFREPDVAPQLGRQMRRQIADLAPPPASPDQSGQQPPGAETREKLIHPLGKRQFNYGLIFVHDLSVPETRMRPGPFDDEKRRDAGTRTHSYAQAASHVRWWKNAEKGREND